jgi:hypothetical protein
MGEPVAIGTPAGAGLGVAGPTVATLLPGGAAMTPTQPASAQARMVKMVTRTNLYTAITLIMLCGGENGSKFSSSCATEGHFSKWLDTRRIRAILVTDS